MIRKKELVSQVKELSDSVKFLAERDRRRTEAQWSNATPESQAFDQGKRHALDWWPAKPERSRPSWRSSGYYRPDVWDAEWRELRYVKPEGLDTVWAAYEQGYEAGCRERDAYEDRRAAIRYPWMSSREVETVPVVVPEPPADRPDSGTGAGRGRR